MWASLSLTSPRCALRSAELETCSLPGNRQVSAALVLSCPLWLQKGACHSTEAGCSTEASSVALSLSPGCATLCADATQGCSCSADTSARVQGPYEYLGSFRPHGQQARDLTVFQDEDGSAYLAYSSENNMVRLVSSAHTLHWHADAAPGPHSRELKSVIMPWYCQPTSTSKLIHAAGCCLICDKPCR